MLWDDEKSQPKRMFGCDGSLPAASSLWGIVLRDCAEKSTGCLPRFPRVLHAIMVASECFADSFAAVCEGGTVDWFAESEACRNANMLKCRASELPHLIVGVQTGAGKMSERVGAVVFPRPSAS